MLNVYCHCEEQPVLLATCKTREAAFDHAVRHEFITEDDCQTTIEES